MTRAERRLAKKKGAPIVGAETLDILRRAHEAHRAGRFAETIPLYRAFLQSVPEEPETLNNLGVALKETGQYDEALAVFDKALALAPDFKEALSNKGMTLRRLKRSEEAAGVLERAVALDPSYVFALSNLGNALRDLGRLAEAEDRFRAALALAPDFAQGYSNLGNVLKDQGRLEEAFALYARAQALAPSFADAPYNKGCILHEQGRLDAAAAAYKQALACQPDYADAHWNLAHLKLLNGDFEGGWRDYEWRWRKTGALAHGYSAPLWDGGDLAGRTILLHAEQGLGDSLQFVRYAPMVKAKGGRVVLSVPKPLVRLFRLSMPEIDEIVAQGDPAPLPPHHCRAPLMSLPLLFGTRLETVPAKVPYLAAAPDQAASWAARVGEIAQGKKKIGLVWAGSPRPDLADAHAVDQRRSMRLEQFAPLAGIEGVHFFSLQKGEGTALQAQTPPAGMALADLMDEARDFADTAAFVAALDLVIGVDTSVIHLAGGMGKPVWVLSRFDGCWRWLLERADSPWYPTLRLFRQKRPADWENVVAEVKAALALEACA